MIQREIQWWHSKLPAQKEKYSDQCTYDNIDNFMNIVIDMHNFRIYDIKKYIHTSFPRDILSDLRPQLFKQAYLSIACPHTESYTNCSAPNHLDKIYYSQKALHCCYREYHHVCVQNRFGSWPGWLLRHWKQDREPCSLDYLYPCRLMIHRK